MRTPTSRLRALTAVGTASGLGLALLVTAAASPSQAATGTCDTAYPEASITAGQAVTGETVSSGTTPTAFSGTVLGVVDNGIEPGVDMIMARLSSSEINRVGGIWEGMSGSPVYAADGRLIGAVSYGLAFGTTPVAGITPYQDMQTLTTSRARVSLPRAAAAKVARAAGVTTSQAGRGFSQLRVPVGVSGISAQALSRDLAHAHGRAYLQGDRYATGSVSGTNAPTAADIVAGGNLAATMSTGDILQGGIGTVTTVCNGAVIGFGHPMNFIGKATYGLAGADTVYVQEDPLGVPFKVANIGTLLGTITQDRMTGIAGVLGSVPVGTPISSTVTYGTRSRTGTSQVQMPDATALTTNFQLVANQQAVLDAYQGGSEKQSWTINGHTASGPFTISGGNRYADPFDIIDASAFDLPDLVYLLTNVPGVSLDSVTDNAKVIDNPATWKIDGAQQHRKGGWHTVDGAHPAVVKAGSTLRMRVVLTGPAGTTKQPFSLKIPRKATAGPSRVLVSAAEPFPFEQSMPNSLAGVRKLASSMVRNDQMQVDLSLAKGKSAVDLTTTTAPLGRVVTGHGGFKVKVLR